MDPGQAKAIFADALELPPDRQDAFVQQACAGDDILRAQVEGLLRAHRSRPGILEGPADTPLNWGGADVATALVGAGSHSRRAEQPGDVIDRYRLVRLLGEGGFGSVFLAQQTEPVIRDVALKVIKLGMDTQQVIGRFEAERQALAMMDHPNIARVFDAGATETGRPYFVMELVQGVPILNYCDGEKLNTSGRLEVFVDVCNAIQHAHQKGIIHRDIKPSNILVTLHDGKPVPKVIDFGIAKATSAAQADQKLLTQHQQMIGTPAYMSPEQAEMSSADIDTRSDIYSLGVLLYELLTGTTPFSNDELISKGLPEMMRVIRELEPPKPSTRLSALGEGITRTAELRRSDPQKLSWLLRNDLDWIVMKCLEKPRQRRYDTAHDLALDVRRYLSGDAVVAAPPSRVYRMRKALRRNKAAYTAAALVTLALVLGVIGTTWGLLRAKANERAARQAQQLAEQRLSQVERGSTLLTDIFNDLDLGRVKQSGRPLEAELGDRLTKAAEQLEGQSIGDVLLVARMQQRLGLSLHNLGHYAPAAMVLEKSVKTLTDSLGPDHIDTLTSVNHLANAYFGLGRYPDAIKLHEQILPLRQAKLGADHPDTMTTMSNLALCYAALGRYEEALKLNERTLALRKAKLGADHPDTLLSMQNLANSYAALNRYEEALTLREEALAMRTATLGPNHPYTWLSMNNLANTYSALGRHDQAIRLHEQALTLQRAKLGADHPDTLRTLNNLAASYSAAGRYSDALPLYQQTLDVRRAKLGPDHPDTLKSMQNLSNTYTALGRNDEALKLRQETLALRKAKLGPDHPETYDSAIAVCSSLERLGRKMEQLPILDSLLSALAAREGDPIWAAQIPGLQVRACQLRGDVVGCRRAFDRLAALAPTDYRARYQLACSAARLAATAREATSQSSVQADADATHAVDLLRQAVTAGYRNADWISQDPVWDLLRQRDDFKQLIAEMTAQPPASAPVARP
jgi:serine/threonine protein kinase/tetratricopeptide (TPR) repeat protein